jgi:hypothetical protein
MMKKFTGLVLRGCLGWVYNKGWVLFVGSFNSFNNNLYLSFILFFILFFTQVIYTDTRLITIYEYT